MELTATKLADPNTEYPNRGFSMTFGDTKVILEGENRAVEIVEADRTVVIPAVGECMVSSILVVLQNQMPYQNSV